MRSLSKEEILLIAGGWGTTTVTSPFPWGDPFPGGGDDGVVVIEIWP